MRTLHSPMRFQAVTAVLAISGALLVTEGQGARPPEPTIKFSLQDPAINESSGLIDIGARVLTVNDSGDGPVVYVVDSVSGETVGRTTFTEDEVVDVEALALGRDGDVWVGDIGDNRGRRTSVAVYRMLLPTGGDNTVTAERFDLVYEGGPRDAEALLVHPRSGRLYVVSKGLFSGQVFAAPRRLASDRVNVLRPVGDVGGLITDGAFFPDGRHVALRSYSNLIILTADSWKTVDGMPLPDQAQGEGVAVRDPQLGALISTEGGRSDVQLVPLTEQILGRVAAEAADDPAPSPDAATTTTADEPASTADSTLWSAVAVAALATAVALAISGWLRRRRR